MSKDTSITVRVPEAVKKRLQLRAKQEGREFANYMRELFARELNESQQPQIDPQYSKEQTEFNQVLLQEVGSLKQLLKESQDEIQSLTGVHHKQFRSDVMAFFRVMLLNPELLPEQGRQVSRDQVIQLLTHMFPDEFTG